MIIDLHVHTNALSPCSNMDPGEAVRQARSAGLDGVCFTEHGRRWKKAELRELSRQEGFPIFCGMEVETREGHMLVFGLEEDCPGIFSAQELHQEVEARHGLMFAAHPFRGFLLFGAADLQLSVERASSRPVWQWVDGLEVCSGRCTQRENAIAAQVQQRLGIRGIGGSDAHTLTEVGRCVTIFNGRVEDEAELVEALRRGQFRAGYWEENVS